MRRLQLATVEWQVATYKGRETVNCFDDTPEHEIIAKARAFAARDMGGSLPWGYEHWAVVNRQYVGR